MRCSTCPNCGYCPCCGRGARPYHPAPWPRYPYPYYYGSPPPGQRPYIGDAIGQARQAIRC